MFIIRHIEYKNLDIIVPYINNPRNNEGAVDRVAASIKEFGFNVPLVLDSDNVIITGHTRYKAAKKLGLESVPCIYAEGLTPAQVKAYRIADNKVSEFASWDDELLGLEFEQLQELDFNMELTGFDMDEINDLLNIDVEEDTEPPEITKMTDKYLVPPFSVLDTKQGYWQDRKKEWLGRGIRSEESREDIKTYNKSFDKEKYGGSVGIDNEVSVFCPVLCEVMYKWFNIAGGSILDIFAGGSVRGIVADKLGYKYTGVDLRQEQVDANYRNAEELGSCPTWICDDSRNIDNHFESNSFDMVFTCPPYADLEVYSDNPQDLSTMEYKDFIQVYSEIIAKAADKLKDSRFFVIVVGEVRGKGGAYYNFVGDTISACKEAGLHYYNELVLVTPAGTLPLRAGKIMDSSRKIGKQHQNVLVFYKGDIKDIKAQYGAIS